jgi:hypothetical protein
LERVVATFTEHLIGYYQSDRTPEAYNNEFESMRSQLPPEYANAVVKPLQRRIYQWLKQPRPKDERERVDKKSKALVDYAKKKRRDEITLEGTFTAGDDQVIEISEQYAKGFLERLANHLSKPDAKGAETNDG